VLTCELCNQEIEEPREAWRQATGWVNPKGAKAMTGMQQTGKLAHATCITALRAGVAPSQGQIV
jgi:hypothetical protein